MVSVNPKEDVDIETEVAAIQTPGPVQESCQKFGPGEDSSVQVFPESVVAKKEVIPLMPNSGSERR